MSLWNRFASYPRSLKNIQHLSWPTTASRLVKRLVHLAPVAIALMAGGGIAHAGIGDFDYDFENLTLGDINGQDEWVVTSGVAWVAAGSGVNSTKTVTGPFFGASEDVRTLLQPFHYTAADTAVVWSFQGLVGVSCCNSSSIVAFIGQTTNFGLDKTFDGFLKARLSAGPIYGDTLEFAHWYEIKVTIDFSVAGGLATLAYRDLTLNQQTFTIDETLRNINLGASADAQGRYTFHTVYTRQDSVNGVCFVDKIHFDAPRPPCPAHTGDMDGDTHTNGRDVQRLSQAMVSASTAFADTCPGDFDDSGTVDLGDIPGFVGVLLAP
jgi:hypothetical protein